MINPDSFDSPTNNIKKSTLIIFLTLSAPCESLCCVSKFGSSLVKLVLKPSGAENHSQAFVHKVAVNVNNLSLSLEQAEQHLFLMKLTGPEETAQIGYQGDYTGLGELISGPLSD